MYNWPEHLRVLHRLTKHTLFRFEFYEGHEMTVYYEPDANLWTLGFEHQAVVSVPDRAMTYHLSGLVSLTLVRSV